MTLRPGLAEAVSHLSADGFVAYPTETVWGLGACADRPAAIDRLMAWKGRANDAPMSVLVPSAEFAQALGCEIQPMARRLIERFWPGPLTVVVPCSKRFAPGVAGPTGALGLRCSSHPLAHALACALVAAGRGPLTSTSMNPSGEAPAATEALAQEMIATHQASLAASQSGDPLGEPVVFGPSASGGDAGGSAFATAGSEAGGAAPSSVVDCTGERPIILRAGALSAELLESVWSSESP